MAEGPDHPGIPHWARAAVLLALLVAAAFGAILFTGVGGPHGPGRHLPPQESGRENAPEASGQ